MSSKVTRKQLERMMKVEEELKPCPFCGCKAEYYGECDMVWVRCSNDGCQAQRIRKFDEQEDAAADWNGRSNQIARVIARNLIAWDTSKDKREGLLPEVYLTNKVLYKQLTGEEYIQHKAMKKFHVGDDYS